MNLSLDNIEFVEVLDVVGRKVLAISCVEQSIDLSTLPSGSYSIVVYSEDEVYSAKMLISK